MRLTELHVQGFRSLKDVCLAFDDLTVLIGENDAGKSSVLDILALCLSSSRPDSSDFYSNEDHVAVEKITAVLTFALDNDDGQARSYAIEDSLRIRYVFSADGLITREYNAEVPVDERLRKDFAKLNASEQKGLLQELEPNVNADEIGNSEKRIEKFSSLRDAAPTIARWMTASPKWGDFLPRFERYSSLDYSAPENMIAKTLIDRAPAKSVRLFRLCEEGYTETSSLATDDDANVEKFLDTMAKELGITNSLIFYERCFILIEGETEENALPILYRKLYGSSVIEDCIRIINVRSNGAVKEFLKLLSRNRKELTIVFVDSDTKTQRAAKLTEDVLKQAGFDDQFVAGRVRYAGQQEFEDIFTDEMIAGCLEAYWPKADGNWEADEIAAIRSDGKFSDGIGKLVWEGCGQAGERWTKPIFGQRIAEICEPTKVPRPVSDLFLLARQVAGIEDA